MRPVDSHCHIQFEQFDDDRNEIIVDIEENLEFAVLAGVSKKDNSKCVDIAEKSDSLRYCLGLHPLYLEKSNVSKVRTQIEKYNPVAVGEIGLDYNYITSEEGRDKSEQVFREMMNLAEEKDLGAVIHSRNAEKKCFEISQSFDTTCFFHCFNGRPELAEKITKSGHYIGITGQIFDSSRVRNIVKALSLEGIMIETDSPFLGKEERNTPLTSVEIAGEIAKVKDIELKHVIEQTSENSQEFFS